MPSSGKRPPGSPAPGYAQSIRRRLRRIWNPSLVRLEAEIRELQARYEALQAANEVLKADNAEIKVRSEEINTRHEQDAQVNRSAAEECRQRAALLLFETHNHLEHLAARLTGANPSAYEAPSTRTPDDPSLPATLEQCRAQLAQLLDDTRSGFARVNEWLDDVLRPRGQLGHAEAFEFLRTSLQWLRLDAGAFDSRKVLMIGSTLGPGGGERQLAITARGLKKANAFDVRVIMTNMLTPTDAFFKPAIEEAEIPVTALSTEIAGLDDARAQFVIAVLKRFGPPDFDRLAREILALAFVLRQERPGVVHCWQDQTNITGGLAAQIAGVPRIILGCRSLTPVKRPQFQPYMHPAYLSFASDPTILILNNSRAGAEDYARWLEIDTDRIAVVRNGFEFPEKPSSEAAKSALRSRLGIPDDAPVVGSIIRFMEVKRPELLIDSLAAVLKARPDAHAVVFGNGPELDAIRERAALVCPDGRIHLPGPTTDIWTAAEIMDLFVLASRVEGLPNVLVEAQASGVPIVATDVGGAREAFQENVTGWSVPADVSAAELAEHCLDILSDDARRRSAGEKARVFVRERFSADRMIAETLAAYGQPGLEAGFMTTRQADR